MPRKARIDAPGALHHIIVRGIERRKIFIDDEDREDFLQRLGSKLPKTGTACYAWALVENHFHLLLRTGTHPIADVMRRLLTGYVLTFNRRHSRCGVLFQNRYKSVLCQEEPYFLQLVRYIHLNPLRAELVTGLDALDQYPYSGHSAIMGKLQRSWQACDDVLRHFSKTVSAARKGYRNFLEKGIADGRRPDLIGGGLIRSIGGWQAIKAMRRCGAHQKSDERILGNSDFVTRTLARAGEQFMLRSRLKAQGYDLDALAVDVEQLTGISSAKFLSPGRQRHQVRARSLFCYWAVRDLGSTASNIARMIGISAAAVSISVQRGRQIVEAEDLRMPPLEQDHTGILK